MYELAETVRVTGALLVWAATPCDGTILLQTDRGAPVGKVLQVATNIMSRRKTVFMFFLLSTNKTNQFFFFYKIKSLQIIRKQS